MPEAIAQTGDATGRRVIATVLGPLKIIPECKAQAVCVNGPCCWEAGKCLKAEVEETNDA